MLIIILLPCLLINRKRHNKLINADGKYFCAKLKSKTKLRWVTQVRVAAGYHEPLELTMKLIFERKKSLFESVFDNRAYHVIIDGKEAGRIPLEGTLELEIPQDEHLVHLKIDWCTSNSITIDANVVIGHYICRNTCANSKVWIPLYIPLAPWYYITFGRRNYLTLECSNHQINADGK